MDDKDGLPLLTTWAISTAQLAGKVVAICHSLLEDTLLFVAIGAWAFWISVPRMAMAAAVVWCYRIAVQLHKAAAR